jgi:hypothetical protein
MPASRVGVTPAGFELLLVQYYRSVRSQRSHLLTMSLLSGCDGGTNRPFLQNPCRRRSGFLFLDSRISHQSQLSSNVVFVLQIHWIAHFPGIIRVCSPKVEHLLTIAP